MFFGTWLAIERVAARSRALSIEDIEHHSAGQGISLAIARRVARLHGGDLDVANTPSGGGKVSVPVVSLVFSMSNALIRPVPGSQAVASQNRASATAQSPRLNAIRPRLLRAFPLRGATLSARR